MLDDGGFDWTLVGHDSQRVDSVTRAQFILNHSQRIKPVVAHRRGVQFPTQFAKAIAGLDRIGGGRVAIHIIAGGSDAEMHREGDYTTKEQRYRRAEEFIDIVRRIWTQAGGFDRSSPRPTSWPGRKPIGSWRAHRRRWPTGRGQRDPQAMARRARSARASARPACESWPSVASCTTVRSGPHWRRRSVGLVRRRPWSAPMKRSPRRWSITRRSAATCCRSVAGTSTRMRKTTRGTCSRWCARNWHTARRPAPRRSSTRTRRHVTHCMRIADGQSATSPCGAL